MGAAEELSKTATAAVEGLKTNPACLAALLIAIAAGWLFYNAGQNEAARRAHTVDLMLQRCFPTEGGGIR